MIFPALLVDHNPADRLAAEKKTGQVGVQDPTPVLFGYFQGRFGDVDAGVVDQDIDATEMLKGLFHPFFNIGFLGNVHRHHQTPAAELADFLGGLLQLTDRAAGGDDVGAIAGQALSQVAADASTGAGD